MKTIRNIQLGPERQETGAKKRGGPFRFSKALVVMLITGLSFLVGSCMVEGPDFDEDPDWYEHHHHHEYYEEHDPHFEMDIDVEHHRPPDI